MARRLAALVALSILTACADTEPSDTEPSDTEPSNSGIPASTETQGEGSAGVDAPSTSADPTGSAETDVGSADSTTSSRPTASTSTSPSTTTTIPPAVLEACRSLGEDPFVIRSATFDSLTEPDAVSAVCPDALDAMVEARRVIDAGDALENSDLLSPSIECSSATGRVFQLLEHEYEFDLGIIVRAELSRVDANGATVVASGRLPGVDVAVRPERRVRVLVEVPASDLAGSCETRASLFVGESPELPGDVSRPADRAMAPQSIDDAATWFPALIEAERAYRSNDREPELLDAFADLRSSAFATDPGTQLRTFLGSGLDDPAATYELCDVTAVEDADRYAVITHARSGLTTRDADDDPATAPVEPLDTVSVALLRRGDDGRWRWVTEPLRLGPDITTCEVWRSAP